MSLGYTIDPEKKHVHIIGKGPVPMPAMIEIVDQVAEDPRFDSSYSVIFDLTNGSYEAELSDGDAFVSALKRRLGDFHDKVALAVPPELHVLAQMYCVLARVAGFDRMQCFTDLDEARKWCGVMP